MPLLGIKVKVEVQSTLATALVLTAVTKATEGVATYTPGTPPVVGDAVVLTLAGMSEANGQAVRVKTVNTTADTFVLEGLNTTDFGTFTSGSCQVVSTWETYGLAQDITVDEQTPDEIDVTTLLDSEKKIEYGLMSAVKGKIGSLFEATDAALVKLRTYSKANTDCVFRLTFADSSKALFNGKVAIGDAFSMAQGQAAKSGCSFSLKGRQIMFYAT